MALFYTGDLTERLAKTDPTTRGKTGPSIRVTISTSTKGKTGPSNGEESNPSNRETTILSGDGKTEEVTTPPSGGDAVPSSGERTTVSGDLSTGGRSGLSNREKIAPPNGDPANGETVVQFIGGKSNPPKGLGHKSRKKKGAQVSTVSKTDTSETQPALSNHVHSSTEGEPKPPLVCLDQRKIRDHSCDW